LSVLLFGVLNVTPDSFSDGGAYLDPSRAVERARAMVRAGADVIDVGGESTRPPGTTYGTPAEVSAEEELARVLPVVEALVAGGVRVSVDTRRGLVAERVLSAGAAIINDVSGGADPTLLAAAARHGAELILMHTRGRGERSGNNVRYRDVVHDVARELRGFVARAREAGVLASRIWLDPGIGFAKTATQSTELLARLPELCALGQPLLVGTSRKSFLAELCAARGDAAPAPAERVAGSLATATLAVWHGARAIRAHDVEATRQALVVAEAMRGARR
jgi:dihydropteroate synthase